MKIRTKLELAKEKRNEEKELRSLIREEETAVEQKRRDRIKLARIVAEERRRAREGGFFTRSLKSLAKKAEEEARKEYKRKRSGE